MTTDSKKMKLGERGPSELENCIAVTAAIGETAKGLMGYVEFKQVQKIIEWL